MKKPLLLLLTFFTFHLGTAQWVSIPDTNFGTWLNTNGYSACMQGNNSVGWQMDTSCNAVENAIYAHCYNSNILDLTGIQYFDNLKHLNCYGNQLQTFPMLPTGLIALRCFENQITHLPTLPATLVSLECHYNQLSSLPELPDSLNLLRVWNNPLTCLPQLKRIDNLEFFGTYVTCLPNYGNVTYSNPPLNSLPLCDPFNSNGCTVYWNINGQVYNDTNSNCVKDATELHIPNMKVNLFQNGLLRQQTYTGGYGIYSFDTDLGTYMMTIDTAGVPFDILCPISRYDTSIISALDSFDYNKDFALQCKPGFDLEAHSIVAERFRPANLITVNIGAGDATNFYGANCATGTTGTVIVTINGPVAYISPSSGALTPSVSGSTLTYNIADFGNVNFFTDFNIILQTDTNAALGSQVCFTVSITPTVGDNNPANNTVTHCFPVVASFDPNDKAVYPLGDIDTAQEWLTYTVRFQNTGTAEAQHIYVDDTLDTDLDYSSFQLLAYSHQPLVQIKENVVRFNFPNINLPDSGANEPLSHGYVQYKIKLKDNLPIGTQINNTAYIYFDFNAPVVTNTTMNTISLISGISKSEIQNAKFEMFPNPADDFVMVSVDESMIGSTTTITDITGRKMMAVQLATYNLQLTTSAFANGVYFITVTDKEGRNATKKLVVSKH